jgi:tetratricopeptide (TPR) repeat protein
VRRTTGLFILIGSAAAFVAAGCTSTTNGPNGTTTSTAWHWPWSKPAVASLPSAPLFAPDDPTSLASKTPKPGADLYVATARLYEKNGDLNAAELQYQKALSADAGNLPALLAYAHLEDNRRQFSDADRLYKEAIKQHPKEASVFNDRGLSYQSRGKFDDAAKMFAKAIELQPEKPLYRNNMATVLVEMHRPEEAFSQLSAVHSPAVAHYNLATLLHRKGNDQDAQFHFALASTLDSSLVAAHDWATRLGPPANRSAPLMANAQTPLARPSVELQIADRRSSSVPDPSRVDVNQAATSQPSTATVPAEAIVSAGQQAGSSGSLPPQTNSPMYVASRPDSNAPHEVFAPSPPTIVMPPAASAPQAPNLGMRYPEHAPSAEPVEGPIPPSPERLNELPRAVTGLRPLPPVQ